MGPKKLGKWGSNSISHARRSPGLGNGVPIFDQFPLQVIASNPPLARADIQRNSNPGKCRSGRDPLP